MVLFRMAPVVTTICKSFFTGAKKSAIIDFQLHAADRCLPLSAFAQSLSALSFGGTRGVLPRTLYGKLIIVVNAPVAQMDRVQVS